MTAAALDNDDAALIALRRRPTLADLTRVLHMARAFQRDGGRVPDRLVSTVRAWHADLKARLGGDWNPTDERRAAAAVDALGERRSA